MKWFRSRRLALRFLLPALPAMSILLAWTMAQGALEQWVQDIEGSSRFEAVFFRSVMMPGGQIAVRRPPGESRAALDGLVSKSPADADLYLMRARVDEENLDFAAAEADWNKRAQLLSDSVSGQLELADFYHRGLRPMEEVEALAAAARQPSSPADRLRPVTRQRSWRAFERLFALIQAQALPASVSIEQYRAWMKRYPKEASIPQRHFSFLLDQKRFKDAERLIATYEGGFPEDKVFPTQARATLEYRRGSIDRALALYERSFQPLWPPTLVEDYFTLLTETRRLRDFLDRARTAVKENPEDLNAASRVFYYYQQQGNLAEAQRALVEYRLRMESRKAAWKAEQLWTLGRLFEAVNNSNEAARCYFALHSLPGAEAVRREKSLAAIIDLLISAPEQPLQLGVEDFTFLKDIGTLDPYPGFLNGILSLLLNSQQPAQNYSRQEAASVAYFHRARAAELLELFAARYPQSPKLSELRVKLLHTYALYGESDAVIRDGRQFLTAFPRSPERVEIALLVADALAREDRVDEELKVYDSLLEELAAHSGRTPLGAEAEEAYPSVPEQQEAETSRPASRLRVRAQPPSAGGPRSPEYARVLERTIARLVALKRPRQVLALFRREIGRNPNDPGLYERLARFLEQNPLGNEITLVYRQAMERFPDRTWYHKLARLYLRRRQMSEFEKLSEEVIRIFSGSDLENYFREVAGQASWDALLYQQLNLYAHSRFPHNLAFVRNLLLVYERRETFNRTAWERLLHQYWVYDATLRARFFEFLSSEHRLDSELQAMRALNPGTATATPEELAHANPAAARFTAEAELWRCHFEAAASLLRALAVRFPADHDLASRAAALHRSLAAFDRKNTEVAAAITENLSRSDPRDRELLARLGDIYGDRSMFDHARPYWDRMAAIEPGNPEGFLDAATVFWDYYLFDDALRLINEARKKLSKPALYSYEAGAVYEGKHDYVHAVREYLRGTLADEGESRSRSRLLELARRRQVRPLVDQATVGSVSGPNPTPAAVTLRVAVLQATDRRDALEKFLAGLAEKTTSLELLERIDSVAGEQGFDALRERSLTREIDLTHDPLERLRLRLKLARFEEARSELSSARRTVESLYLDNPTILGVVRATVDFYWRNELRDTAIETLLAAANASYPALKKRFTFEAASKATEAGQYARARDLLARLLQAEPYDAQLLAAMADTYAREGNDPALRDFYLAKIQALGQAPLGPEERTARNAALRRGLIPALTRLKDFAGAVDQYIEILNRYPEDEVLTEETAAYADRHSRRKQLLDYYTKATADSPRDFRWPMVLARLETYDEDYPAAILAYARARQVRPDRSDLLMAQARLEERLMRFDDALRSFTTLYDLTYHDSQWMAKVAEIHARTGRTDAAVEALKKALIEGRPERPAVFFEAGKRLEEWGLLPQARELAERGMALAGNDLFEDSSNLEGAQLYGRVMTKLREYEAAYTRLRAARAAAPERAASFLPTVLREMARTVRGAFAPEELAAFESFLQKQKEGMPEDEFEKFLLSLAQNAGLADLETRWRLELMMVHPGRPEAQAQEARLIKLQRDRMDFNDLGTQLEAYWNVYPNIPGKDRLLVEAAQSYRSGGNTPAELRTLSMAFQREGLAGDNLGRYLELLRAQDPSHLIAIASPGNPGPVRDSAANTAVAGGDPRLALQVIVARGQGLPPVWTRAYTGLVGLYHADTAREINAAFMGALGGGTIGERVGKAVDRNEQLAGSTWFYYGSRYGEYLDLAGKGSAEDYLPAAVEARPGSNDAYFALGDYYREAGELDRALAEYARSLELDSERGGAHDRIAVMLWQQGKRPEAIDRWRQALRALARQENRRRVPESFWIDAPAVLRNIGERKLLPDLREEADRLLRIYIRHNGDYRVDPLLEGAMAASGDPGSGVAWVLDLARVAQNPLTFLAAFAGASWVPQPQKELVLLRLLELAKERVTESHGAARDAADGTLREWQMRWLDFLVETRQTERAEAALAALPEADRESLSQQLISIEIRIAAQGRKLDELLDRLREMPADQAPQPETLRSAAAALREHGDARSARRVFEFLYARELDQHNLAPANFLGLAEIRLEEGDLAGALGLLRRMALVSGEPFENLKGAGALLVKAGHPAEAAEFLAARAKAAPWDWEARLDLARAQIAAGRDRDQAASELRSGMAAREAEYQTRAAAAIALAPLNAAAANRESSELELLAAGGPKDSTAAEQPYFYQARLLAEERAGDPEVKIRLLREALGINPEAQMPRLTLFRNAFGARQYQLALSAMEPLIEGAASFYSVRHLVRPSAPALPEEEEGVVYGQSGLGGQFLPGTSLDAPEKAELALKLAEALENLGRLRPAENFLAMALEMEPDKSRRTEMEGRLQALKAKIILSDQDARRRPVVTEHLEQKNVVRPRLSAAPQRSPSAAAPREGSRRGGQGGDRKGHGVFESARDPRNQANE